MNWRALASLIGESFGLLHPHLFTPKGHYPDGEPRTVWVLSPGDIPTTDIYIRTRLQGRADLVVRYFDTRRESPPAGAGVSAGAFVIVVRYAPARWRRYLRQHQRTLAGAVLMLDDDMPDAFADPALPLRYAGKTARRYARSRSDLENLCEAIWVSTPGLQQKYPESPTRLVPPLYLGRPAPAGTPGPTYFYHGSGSHRREIEWLVDVVAEVQKRNPRAEFEIFGTAPVARLYRSIPRVTVRPPLPWREYLAYTASITHAVGLAPLLDTGFNTSRSYNKIFDITRCGAVGIYTDSVTFREPLQNEQMGVLCASDPELWVEPILALLGDPQRCRAMFGNALAWCQQHNTALGLLRTGAD